MMATTAFLRELIKSPDKLNNVVYEAKEKAFEHGLLICTLETSEVVTYAPFTLFPSPVPKAALLQALALQTHFHTLVDKISQDPDFLEEALAGAVQADDFTAKLFGIYRQVQQEGRPQSIVVGLNRSDYMMDEKEGAKSSLKQIEINTIAAAAFAISDHLPVVHRHILRYVGLQQESKSVQDNNKTQVMAAALAKAWELYGLPKSVILFLVDNVQTFRLDYRLMENELRKRNIPVIRRNFEDVPQRVSLDDEKKLFIDGLEVAVVYYRYGYMPDHYTEQAWEARLLIERSLAVKCPDIGTQLAGTKKVQQVCSRPGVLEKFFPDQPQVVEQIRSTFTGLYTLDMNPDGDQTVKMALANPDNFVLKPQREGGGNNYFGEDIVRVLEETKNDKRRAAYILMDRIQPTVEQNILLRRGLPLKLTSVCCEIGIYGAYVRHGRDMIFNECAGHILRTKGTEHSDGGIPHAISVYDSPLLT